MKSFFTKYFKIGIYFFVASVFLTGFLANPQVTHAGACDLGISQPTFNQYPVVLTDNAGCIYGNNDGTEFPIISGNVHGAGSYATNFSANVGDSITLRIYMNNSADENSGAIMHNVFYNTSVSDSADGSSHTLTTTLTASNATNSGVQGSVVINTPAGSSLQVTSGALSAGVGDMSPYFTPNDKVFYVTMTVVANTPPPSVTPIANTPPVIATLGDNPFNLTTGDFFVDPGALATDAEDGSLTPHIIVTGFLNTNTAGTYTLTYSVTDSGGLSASVTRTVIVSNPVIVTPPPTTPPANTAPVIAILGANPATVTVGTTFVDPGALATDAEDGSLTPHIIVTGFLDTNTVGTYTLTYTVTDSGGLSASVTRTVIVGTAAGACPAPAVTSALVLSGTVGVPFSYQVAATAAGNPVLSYSIGTSTLPGGLSFAGSSISGTPTTAGVFPITFTVTNNCGTGTPATISISGSVSISNPAPVNTPPVIELNGANPYNVNTGATFIDPGAIATDAQDGDLTSHIIVTGFLDTNTPGSYTLTYTVTDSGGLSASTTRIVIVSTPNNGGGGSPSTGAITFCLIVADQSNNIATSSIGLPSGTFTIGLGNSTTSVSDIGTSSWTSGTFSPNKKTILSLTNDSQCTTYSALPFGDYYYGQVAVTGAQYQAAKYNDQHDQPVNGLSDFFAYSPELFNANPADDAGRNFGSDGMVTLNSINTSPTVYLLEKYSTTPVNTPPVITLIGANPFHIAQNATFVDPGATATDAQDGDLTSHIIVTGALDTSTIGTYTLTYTVTDSGGLSASTTRAVIVDAPGGGGCTSGCGSGSNCPAPTANSGLILSATIGVPFSYTITASSSVPSTITFSIGSTILPPGLAFSTTTDTISGTPTTTGTYPIAFTVLNDCGNVNGTATVTVNDTIVVSNPGGGPSVPTALLTVNGVASTTVDANVPVTYAWTSTNATNASTTVQIYLTATHTPVANDACVNASSTPTDISGGFPLISGVSGTLATTTLPCQLGYTYDFTYVATNSATGISATSTAEIIVATSTPTSGGGGCTSGCGSSSGCTVNCGGGGGGNGPIVGSLPSGGGGGGIGSNIPLPTPTPTPVITEPGTCDYLHDYLHIGWNNDPVEVDKLQFFLRDLEGYNVQTTGVYDAQTVAAVDAFQLKYASDILVPWGDPVTTASNFTYILTKKKVNEIYCQTAFPITPQEQSVIDAYRRLIQDLNAQGIVITPQTGTSTPVTTGEIGIAPLSTTTGATSGTNSGFFSRFANFAAASIAFPINWMKGVFYPKACTIGSWYVCSLLDLCILILILIAILLWYLEHEREKEEARRNEELNKELDLTAPTPPADMEMKQ